MSDLDKINNYVSLAQDRLIQQYKEKPRMLGFVEAIVKPLQELENAIFDFSDNMWLDKATGKQLDVLGSIAGEERLGRADEDYKAAIFARIAMNVSGGEPDSIISGVQSFIGQGSVEYNEMYPANFHIHITTSIFSKNFRQIVESLKPAGVGKPIITYSATDKSFVFNSIGLIISDLLINTGTIEAEDISPLIIVDDGGVESTLELLVEAPRDGFFEEGFGEVFLSKVTLELEDGTNLTLEDDSPLELILDNAHEDYYLSDFGGELGEAIS